MKTQRFFLLLVCSFLWIPALQAINKWPKEISLKSGGKVVIYQPQAESLNQNVLRTRAAIMIKKTPSAEPIFGVMWSEAILETDRNSRMATLESIKVTDAKFPDETTEAQVDSLKKFLVQEIMKWNLEISLDEIVASLEETKNYSDDKLSMKPPKIVYSDKAAVLLTYDGEPMVKKDEKMNMDRALNTSSLVVKSPENGHLFLYSEKNWYTSDSPKANWTHVTNLPKSIQGLDQQIKKKEKEIKDTSKAVKPAPVVIVATEPTELITSTGEAKFASIENTGLLYMTNSTNHVFMDVAGQMYYVILSGRWYKSAKMQGPWTFVASDQLPAEFAKIPEGSAKDAVLASVAGTPAAKEAVMDAQIPQTAKVDRKKATFTATWDGEPKFEPIEGTSIELAVNTSNTIMKASGKYYAVENGVWFISTSPKGPWSVSDERPADVDKIPATSAAYNTKYVYVYESTPEVVYVGYTPGYTGCYVYGPTVVYGTGYYYAPWYGAYYYPRPVTYGFGFSYNPYTGWGMTVGFSYGMVSMTFGFGGCYYGPHHYHPPCYGHGYHGGYYGRHTTINANIYNRNTNIYNRQDGATTRDRSQRPAQQPGRGNNAGATRPSQQPAGGRGDAAGGARPSQQPAGGRGDAAGGARPSQQPAGNAKPSAGSNNLYTDRQGNVYQQNDRGGYDQRSNGNWNTSGSREANQQMQRQNESRQRSDMRQSSFQNQNRSYGGGSRSGGGMRGGGGGRRR